MNNINLENLLTQVNLIKKKYDDLAEYTGENYNIFNVLNIYGDELSHSKIIGNLLNANGKHGQKDTFLKLFLNQINYFKKDTKLYNNIRSFNSIQSSVAIEKTIGRVDYTTTDGGRIDILINDGKYNIIVENKIWAADGHQQLARYRRYDENAPIIYLTLEGTEPKESSKLEMESAIDYICVSYKNDIIIWLENCTKQVANKPIIRESLFQYITLLKQITNQSTNKQMKEEIINLIFQNEANLEAAKLVRSSLETHHNYLLRKMDEIINNAERIKEKFEQNNCIKNIDLMKRFPDKNLQVVRIDLHFKNNTNEKDFISYQIDYNKDIHNLRTIIWGNGLHYERFKNHLNNGFQEIIRIDLSTSIEADMEKISNDIHNIVEVSTKS